jgi:aldehyde:ferredoxin oxidoreductase
MKTQTGGFAGNVLYVDLTQARTSTEPLNMALAEKFIGGLGLTLKMAYDRIRPGIDALDPANPVVLGAGPLVGTDLPSVSRVYAVSKLPSSAAIGWCGAGGVTFGYLLKNAGYDLVVIEGSADHPVFLKIIDEQVELCDAGHLWGKGVDDTYKALRQESRKPAGVLCIGQAGENQVTYSMAYIDGIATMGRGGLGAVLGAKNLKAVVITGTRGIRVADRRRYKSLRNNFLEKIRQYPYLKESQELGLIKSLPAIPVETYKQIKKRRIACVSCPIGCKDVVEIKNGEFKGLVASSSSAINLLMPTMYGMSDYRQAVKLVATLDGYGLDMFEFMGVMGFARALAENGIIDADDAHPAIVIDSLASMLRWAEKIALRQGLGDILAGGFNAILDHYGEPAAAHAPALVKGMHPYTGPGSALPWDLFGTMELGQILDPRGPHVGSGGSPTYFAKRPLDVFPRHLKRMGVSADAIKRILPDPNLPGQQLNIEALLNYSHRWFCILGSLGVCARAQINRFYNASLCAELYEAVTGIPTDLDVLRLRADRVWTLYKMINVREGIGRETEAVPPRWVNGAGFKNYVTDQQLQRREIEQMAADYYQEWGWNQKSGAPTPGALRKLGLLE